MLSKIGSKPFPVVVFWLAVVTDKNLAMKIKLSIPEVKVYEF